MNLLVVVVEAANEANLQLYASLLNSVQSLVDLGQVGVDRLLTEDVLASLSSFNDEICVRVGGRADEYRVDVLVAENNFSDPSR